MPINLDSFKPGLFISVSNLFSQGALGAQNDKSYECQVFNADKTLTILAAVEGSNGVHYGTTSEQNINFLPYKENNNLYIELGGDQDVMSGVFNGCFMTKYKRKGDIYYRFAHIDTSIPKYGNGFFSNHKQDEFSACFRPSMLGDVGSLQAPLKAGMRLPKGLEMKTNRKLDGAFGLITASGEAFRFFVAPVRDTTSNTIMLVILSHPENVMNLNPEEISFMK